MVGTNDVLPTFTSVDGEAKALSAYQAVIDRWSAPSTELDIQTYFGSTHVIASGREDSPPLVLMHAMFATAAVWYPNAGGLSEHFRVYAVDNIGEANKSHPTRLMKKPDDYVAWFGELLDRLGVQETNLAGNSFGGFLSAYIAMSLPDRLRRLVLISPAATFHQIVPFYIHLFIPKALYIFFPKLPGQIRMLRHSMRWAFAGLPHDRAWTRLFYMMLMHGSTASQVFPRVFSREQLARIEAPTLLLVGDREKIYRPEVVMKAAKKLMPTIESAIVPGAHHIAAQSQPEIVNEHIIRFCGLVSPVSTITEKAQAPCVSEGTPASLVGVS